MAYQHREDGTLTLDRKGAEEVADLMWQASGTLRGFIAVHGPDPLFSELEQKLALAAAALMPF
jgi:hypothetical protein